MRAFWRMRALGGLSSVHSAAVVWGFPAPRMSNKLPIVYILANRPRGVLYVGVTGDIERRLWQHRHHVVAGFTARYNVHRLVYYEAHDNFTNAIRREKSIKRWRRDWKIALVETRNPGWEDVWGTTPSRVIPVEWERHSGSA